MHTEPTVNASEYQVNITLQRSRGTSENNKLSIKAHSINICMTGLY